MPTIYSSIQSLRAKSHEILPTSHSTIILSILVAFHLHYITFDRQGCPPSSLDITEAIRTNSTCPRPPRAAVSMISKWSVRSHNVNWVLLDSHLGALTASLIFSKPEAVT
jgi:hypothetical protein